MKTSVLEEVLNGKRSWKQFSALYQKEKCRLFSRHDGSATSGDLQLKFDSGDVTVTSEQIIELCNSVVEDEIDVADAVFIATVIALSGFEFSNEDVEDAVLFLSSSDSEIPFSAERIQSALKILGVPSEKKGDAH